MTDWIFFVLQAIGATAVSHGKSLGLQTQMSLLEVGKNTLHHLPLMPHEFHKALDNELFG